MKINSTINLIIILKEQKKIQLQKKFFIFSKSLALQKQYFLQLKKIKKYLFEYKKIFFRKINFGCFLYQLRFFEFFFDILKKIIVQQKKKIQILKKKNKKFLNEIKSIFVHFKKWNILEKKYFKKKKKFFF
ncbi:hypothetical protein [Buchnera aphidicola]|uniref:hypothetical protein n=1 Tax=Buchnera aphidicola TaxID=9 RepID=UPI00313DFD4E